MKKPLIKNRIFWFSVISIVLVLAVGIFFFFFSRSPEDQVTNKINIDQAQKIVDETFDSIAKSTAQGAKYILDKTSVTVNSIEYGYEKDVILSCTYEALDVQGALESEIDAIMQNVYGFYLENENAGKKTNATKINLKVKGDMVTLLENAKQISGEVTLYIYETVDGMKLYLNDQSVNTVTGGLITVAQAISATTTVEYEGQIVDISSKNTLRTGILDCIALENYSPQRPNTGSALENAWSDFKQDFYRNFIDDNNYMYLVNGLWVTLLLTVMAAIFGMILGFLIAIVRCTNQMTGKLKILNGICEFYLTVIRGTPVMVQLLILYFVVLLPLGVEKYTAAIVCFGMNSGAYVAEIVRGGIMSVDKGQIEAGRSLGFNYVQTMVHFVVPQAFKAIIPSLANEFITLLKESSVAFTIGVADLTFGGNKIRSTTYSAFLPLLAVALIYLALVMILSKFVSILERRLAKSDH